MPKESKRQKRQKHRLRVQHKPVLGSNNLVPIRPEVPEVDDDYYLDFRYYNHSKSELDILGRVASKKLINVFQMIKEGKYRHLTKKVKGFNNYEFLSKGLPKELESDLFEIRLSKSARIMCVFGKTDTGKNTCYVIVILSRHIKYS